MIGDLFDDGATGGGGASSPERYGIHAEADPAAVRALSRTDVRLGAPRVPIDFGTTLETVAGDFGRAAGSVLEAIPRGVGRAAGAAAGGVAAGLGLPSLPILLGGLALLFFFKD